MYWSRVWNSWMCCTYQMHRVDQWTSLWRSQRAGGGWSTSYQLLVFWPTICHIIPHWCNHSAWRSLLLYNSPSGVTYTTLWTRRRRVVRWYVVHCMHRNGAFCPGSRLGRQPAPRSKPLPIMWWDLCPRHHLCSDRASGREDKDTVPAGC